MLSAAIIAPDRATLPQGFLQEVRERISWNGIFYSAQSDADEQTLLSPEIIGMITDMLIILDPAYTTFAYLAEAVRNGCHLFLPEKLRMSPYEKQQLSQLALEGGTYIQIRNDLLFHPLREQINSDTTLPGFVEIHCFDPALHYSLPEEIYNNILITLRIAGINVHRTHVFASATEKHKSDMVNIHLSFHNGSSASVTLSAIGEKREHTLSVHKDGQFLHIDLVKTQIRRYPQITQSEACTVHPRHPLATQINDFIEKVTCKQTPFFTLNDEIVAFHLFEKIKTKLQSRSETLKLSE